MQTVPRMSDDNQQSSSNWGAVGIAAAGVIQISAGVYLCTTGPLAVVGTCLIRQGSGDIAYAIRTGINRTLCWTDYITEKLISIPFTVISEGVQHWLNGGAANAFRKGSTRKVARFVGLALGRGIGVVYLGKALREAREAILKRFQVTIESKINDIFENEFANLHQLVEDLNRLDPSNAQELISVAFADVTSKVYEDGDICDRIGNAAIEFLPTVLELSLQFISKTTAQDFSDRTMDWVRFVAVASLSVNESRLFARNFMKSLQEALTVCYRRQQRTINRSVISQPADPDSVEESAARFKRRVRSFVTRKVSESIRRGLVQAIAQTIILNGVAAVADVAGF